VPRAEVVVALGPTRIQTKRLTKLPAVPDERRLSRLVNCNANAYFVKNGIPLAISSVDVRMPGEGWSAAAEVPALETIHATCIAQSLDLRRVVPSVVALPYAIVGDELSWRDGSISVTATYDDQHRIVSIHRKQCQDVASPVCPESNPGGLEEALGATRVPAAEPLAIRPKAFTSRHANRVSNRALVIAATCAIVSGAIYVIAPVAVARSLTRQAAPSAGDTLAARAVAWTERELATTTTALTTLATFQTRRIPVLPFLAHLTEAVPGEMTVTDLRFDDLGGSLTILGPRVAGVASLLSDVPELTAPELTGAITSQTVGPDRLERVTVRFSWRQNRNRANQR
jgi:hypothetical protein